jgi:hypothetical protein
VPAEKIALAVEPGIGRVGVKCGIGAMHANKRNGQPQRRFSISSLGSSSQ